MIYFGIIICFLYSIILTFPLLFDWYKKYKSKTSFKVGFDLTDLPVVTFYHGQKKLNFLVDTGSNNNIINESSLVGVDYAKSNTDAVLWGLDGIKRNVEIVSFDLYYNKKKYSGAFQKTDMSQAFDSIKSDTGCTIDGILGTNFLNNQNSVIDFKDYIIYSK